MSTSSTHRRAAAAAAAADAEVREARIAAVEVVVQQAAETTRAAVATAEAAVAAVVALRKEDVDDQDGARPRGPHGCDVVAIITSTEEAEMEAFKAQMKGTVQMNDLGLLCFYLSIEVHQDDGGITLHQAHYAKHIVELVGMGGCNSAHTLMEERLLSRYSLVEEVDAMQY
jgi:hypothetical protein